MQTIVGQVEDLASRIERAYARRRPSWAGSMPSSTVWTVVAAQLQRLHLDDPSIPIDPELYVAAQPLSKGTPDPWRELAREVSATRYQRRIQRIVAGLRRELRGEVLRGLGRIRLGEAPESVLASRSRSLSPLGRFILARRLGRSDLADRFRAQAQAQHRSCPLYRQASRTLLNPDAYPVLDLLPGVDLVAREAITPRAMFSVN